MALISTRPKPPKIPAKTAKQTAPGGDARGIIFRTGQGIKMKFSPDQENGAKAVAAWIKDRSAPQVFYLSGLAGTGKTTLARILAQDAGKVVYAAFTGKAALVLASKGCRPASTIHSLIYKLDDPDSPISEFVLNEDSAAKNADLIVIDEVSMVGEELARDLLSFGTRVLVLGDPGQLPPVNGQGYFTSRKPDFMLTEIHRQAAESPVIQLAMNVRKGGKLSLGNYGSSRVISRNDLNADMVLDADQVLVGTNQKRRLYNQRVRELKGYTPEMGAICVGERMVTLKNNKEKGVLNGALWDVTRVTFQDEKESRLHLLPVDAGGNKAHVEILTNHLWLSGEEHKLDWRQKKAYDPADFGYVLSCHKAQGSQWDDVLIFDESATFREDARAWLYTAITRAAERVTIVI